MAGNFIRRRNLAALHHRLRLATGRVQRNPRAGVVVRPPMGEDTLLPGFHRKIQLRHRRLRILHSGMRRRKRRSTGNTGGVHPERRRWTRFLRRQPRGRLQPPDDGGASGRNRRRELHGHGLRGGLERGVPDGAESDECRYWRRRRWRSGV